MEVCINNNTNNLHTIQGDHYRGFFFIFYGCLYKWLWRLGEIKYLSSWLEGRESSQYIAAVSLQRTRGLIVAEFSARRLMPQVPLCDSWCSDGSKPPFALLAALFFHMLAVEWTVNVGRSAGHVDWVRGTLSFAQG